MTRGRTSPFGTRAGIRRLFRVGSWRTEDVARDLNDEMEMHIALRAEQLTREGMTTEHAEAEARRMFAQNDRTLAQLHNVALERNRHMRMREKIESVMQDVRYALRRLTREPAITTFILITLAFGIGINVTSFSIVDRVLLRGPQHVREPERLVRLYSRVDQPSLGLKTSPFLPHTAFVVLRDELRTVDGIGAYRMGQAMVGSGASAEMHPVSMMSSETFKVLGVRPVKGRFFDASEDADNVAVIGERYWRSTMASDADAIGKSIAIDDVPHTIIGIAPNGFTGAELRRSDVWTPISVAARNSMNMHIVARLKAGVTADALALDISRVSTQIDATLPRWAQWLRGAKFLAAPIAYDDNARESLESVMARWLAAISAIILFISCANVANLLLARLARRRRELAVRIALGSGQSRVVRLVAIEGALLAIGATMLAFSVVAIIEPIVQGALFPAGAWAFTVLDGRVLGSIAAFMLIAGLLVSIVPALQAGKQEVGEALRSGNRGGEARSALRAGLTVVQATLSVVLLVGAGLFLRSLQRVDAVDLGMDADRVLTVELRAPRSPRNAGETFSDWLKRTGLRERERLQKAVEIARRIPGVEHAAVSVGIPFYGSVSVGLWVPGRDSVPAMPGGGPYITAVGPDYFTTMGTAIRSGRAFTESDRDGSEPVVIVSETMANALWPKEQPIGKCVILFSRESACARVIGVSADLHRSGIREEASMQYYVPIGQERGFSGSYLLVRPRGEVTTAWPALREALQRTDADVRSVDVRVLSQGLDVEMRPFRLGMMAFGLSAALALVVAGLGLYSVMAHAVAWRRHEIGVRMALGAKPVSIATMVVARGATLAAAGITLGLFVALAARRFVEPMLFETSATDPLVIVGVIVVVQLMAVLAGYMPARQAVRVSPMEALRAE